MSLRWNSSVSEVRHNVLVEAWRENDYQGIQSPFDQIFAGGD